MHCRSSLSTVGVISAVLASFVLISSLARAQHGSEGTVNVTVVDPGGEVVSGAQLELQDAATNDVRKAETQGQGSYTFVNLSVGKYRLTISRAGFQ